MSRPPSPRLGKGYFSGSFERFVRDEGFEQLSSAFTLLGTLFLDSKLLVSFTTITDTVETYFDSHVDLLQRKLQKHSDKLKLAAEEASMKIKDLKIKDLSGDMLAENFERELKSLKVKVK